MGFHTARVQCIGAMAPLSMENGRTGHLTALANNRTLPSQPYAAALVKLGLVVQGRERLW